MSDIANVPDSRELREKLSGLGLDEVRIGKYNLDELKDSYKRLKDFEDDPNNFSDLKIPLTVFGQKPKIYRSKVFFKLEKLILDRINLLSRQEIKGLQDTAKRSEDNISAQTFSKALKSIEEIIDNQNLLNESERKQVSFEQEKELYTLRMEMEDRNTKRNIDFWGKFLAKESVATFVGAFIILIIVGFQIAGIFLDKAKPPEILNNTLLIVLGFFFGQSSNKGKGEND
ncbi:MAG: hypothetical protein IM542_19680 [Pseudanabaena sp. M165S2SP1A06QC]|nr:hypothetical protein [Pseudanabaena sp. M165S2SP1A06QC]